MTGKLYKNKNSSGQNERNENYYKRTGMGKRRAGGHHRSSGIAGAGRLTEVCTIRALFIVYFDFNVHCAVLKKDDYYCATCTCMVTMSLTEWQLRCAKQPSCWSGQALCYDNTLLQWDLSCSDPLEVGRLVLRYWRTETQWNGRLNRDISSVELSFYFTCRSIYTLRDNFLSQKKSINSRQRYGQTFGGVLLFDSRSGKGF